MRRDGSGGSRKSRGAKRKEEIEVKKRGTSVSFLQESPPLITRSRVRIFLAKLIRNNDTFRRDLQG